MGNTEFDITPLSVVYFNPIGERYGSLVITGVTKVGKLGGVNTVHVKCDCGNKRDANYALLRRGVIKTCGIKFPYVETFRKKKGKVEIGMRFGKLTVIDRNYETRKWVCKCDCGNITEVNGSNLIRGLTTSCGQHMGDRFKGDDPDKSNNRPRITDDEDYKSHLYREYCYMFNRVMRKSNIRYEHYSGATGRPVITICDEWLGPDGFRHFKAWSLENGYRYEVDEKGRSLLSLNRKNNDGPYAPWNCEWADRKTQANNKSINRLIYDGEEWLTFAQFEDKYGWRKDRVASMLGNTIVWSYDSIVYAAKHPELGLHFHKNMSGIRDKDNFLVLIPHIDIDFDTMPTSYGKFIPMEEVRKISEVNHAKIVESKRKMREREKKEKLSHRK